MRRPILLAGERQQHCCGGIESCTTILPTNEASRSLGRGRMDTWRDGLEFRDQETLLLVDVLGKSYSDTASILKCSKWTLLALSLAPGVIIQNGFFGIKATWKSKDVNKTGLFFRTQR